MCAIFYPTILLWYDSTPEVSLWRLELQRPGKRPLLAAQLRSRVKQNLVHHEKLSPGKRLAVVLCFLLIAAATFAQAFHLHPNDLANEAKHCTICQVAHAPAQLAPVAKLPVVLALAILPVLSPHRDPKQRLDAFSLFSRPPPLV
jgi:hypothetical protein